MRSKPPESTIDMPVEDIDHSIETSEPEGDVLAMNSGDSRDHERVGFKREEIIKLYYRYSYELNYIVSFFDTHGDSLTYVALTNNLEQVSFSHAGHMDSMSNYIDLGYERDEEFERCLRVVLVEGELGLLYFRRIGELRFGSNMPLQYWHIEPDIEPDSTMFGRIEGNWYYQDDAGV